MEVVGEVEQRGGGAEDAGGGADDVAARERVAAGVVRRRGGVEQTVTVREGPEGAGVAAAAMRPE